jgi:WD40 repeat protein
MRTRSPNAIPLTQLAELFDEALTLDTLAREDYLRALAEKDPACALELRELLAELPDPELPPHEGADGEDVEPEPFLGEPSIGEIIGGCTLTAVLGRGGAGTVFAADQQEPARKVAVKVLRTGNARMSQLRRFRLEAFALGRLEHPAIARIYSSGIVQREGADVPYIVMERVEGAVTFVEWARDAKYWKHESRDYRRLAEAMANVCEGMHRGHSRGVMHRDLKPSNILMDRDGAPRIIDFGIARLLDQSGDALEDTQAGAIIGTPSYMAPEQFVGVTSDLDLRVDIHALGVLFYEALAGNRPYDIPRHLYFNAARIIESTHPPELHSRDSRIPSDLSAIVAKAMAKDRAHRYQSMAEFADDLRAFIAGRAVRARPETSAQRFVRFVRRNPAWSSAITVIVFALFAATAFSTWQWKGATHALMLAQLARAVTAAESNNIVEAVNLQAEFSSTLDPRLSGFIITPIDRKVLTVPFESTNGHLIAGAISPDGSTWLASADGSDTIHIVDLNNNTTKSIRLGTDANLNWAVGFSRDGAHMYAANPKGLFEFDREGNVRHFLKEDMGQARGLEVSADGTTVYTLGESSWLARCNVDGTGATLLLKLPLGASIGALVSDGHERMFAVAGSSFLHAITLESAAEVAPGESPKASLAQAFKSPAEGGASVALSADGSTVAFGTSDGYVRLLDAVTGAELRSVRTRHQPRTLQFSPSGRYLFAGDRGGRVHRIALDGIGDSIADGISEHDVQSFRTSEPVWALGARNDTEVVANIGLQIVRVDFSQRWSSTPPQFPTGIFLRSASFDGQRVRAIGSDGIVRELDFDRGSWEELALGDMQVKSPMAGALSENGRFAAVFDGSTVTMRELSSGASTMCAVTAALNSPSLWWNPSATRLALASQEGLRIVARDGTPIGQPIAVPEKPLSIAWLSDDRCVANYLAQGYRAQDCTIRGDTISVNDVSASGFMVLRSQNRWIALSISGSIEVSVPDQPNARRPPPLEYGIKLLGHDDMARCASISPDGVWLASGGFDGKVRLFNLASQECFIRLTAFDTGVEMVRWSPDGKSLLCVDYKGRLRYYDSVSRSERFENSRGEMTEPTRESPTAR